MPRAGPGGEKFGRCGPGDPRAGAPEVTARAAVCLLTLLALIGAARGGRRRGFGPDFGPSRLADYTPASGTGPTRSARRAQERLPRRPLGNRKSADGGAGE